MDSVAFFQKNPQYRYAMLRYFIDVSFFKIIEHGINLKPFEIFDTIKQEFGSKLGEHDVLVAALCTIINTQQKNFAVNAQKFQQFAAQAQARIAQLEAQLKTK